MKIVIHEVCICVLVVVDVVWGAEKGPFQAGAFVPIWYGILPEWSKGRT